MTIHYGDLQEPLNKFSTLVELLRYRASSQPERIAYIFLRDGEIEEARLTYGELDQKARAIAAHLQSLEAKGERGLLLYPPGLDFISAFFGCLYAEVVAIPAYPPPTQSKPISLTGHYCRFPSPIHLYQCGPLPHVGEPMGQRLGIGRDAMGRYR